MVTLERTDVDGVTVLRFAGTLDRLEVGGIEKRFRDAAHHHSGDPAAAAAADLIIDLAGVDFLATPAISMLLAAAKSRRPAGGHVVVSGPRPQVAEVFRRLRLASILPVAGSVAEAVKLARLRREPAADARP